MSELDARGVDVRFGSTRALDSVDLCVEGGRILALVGPSGSGKSTFLRAVAGFVTPDAGTIRVGGRTLVGDGVPVPPERRGLGMVFQHHAVWPHMSVAENVAYPLRRARWNRVDREKRVAEVLATVELGDLADRAPDTLSGGQRQRVSLARALVARPEVLLLDEALSALDEPLRASLRLMLRRLAAENELTMVHVTHDRDEALAIGDQVAVLDRGRVVQVGSPAELDASPRSEFVARFLHDAACVAGRMSGGRFRSDDGRVSVPAAALGFPSGPVDGPAYLALPPDGLELVEESTGEGVLPVEVLTSLYGRRGRTVICRSGDLELRVLTPGVDDALPSTRGARVRRGFVYSR
ncbi:ABC transporter ATP-binding protein [Dietzia sp. PP-33]|jgi:iron(III) transport system ATP-binding protein|uniref:ABC transporter ATP-binding protein n=1 Tax=Dietzia sp. PP-33 TaxID=2957500 RepID=UPI0029BF6619|nr:ABC transporter ATP-binding protein [Dietzia sp. PP-33]MDX2358387.1 ABC transporter ATP-binding protein [Dietzia sp. PP-33]